MRKLNFQIILCYILWLITTTFTFYLLLLFRGFYLKIMPFITKNILVINFVDKLLFIVFAVLALGIIMGVENYYRKGLFRNNLLQRFLYITGIEIFILFIFQYLPPSLYGVFPNNFQVLMGILKLGAAIFLIYISQRKPL
ncbi:MAG: hypothetical protein NZ841_07450 [Dictyoglomus sp.]|nr:hypothetical protein [Dictyoglomus sp.]MDW8189113.1 hypothetical protein [Dictyoglomus sp.]